MNKSLQESIVKFALSLVTISIGVWCGIQDSYSSFYIAVLIQALNNLYESFTYLNGYDKFTTVFQCCAFIGGVFVVILAIVHFSPGGSIVDSTIFAIIIVILISAPVVYYARIFISLLMHWK